MTIATALVMGMIAGSVTAAVVARWPRVDPGSPGGPTRVVADRIRRHRALARWLDTRVRAETATGVSLTLAVLAIVVAGIVTGVVLAMVRTNSGFASFDDALAKWGADHATPWSSEWMTRLTELGGTVFVVVASVVVAAVEYRRRPSWAVPVFLTVAIVGQKLLVNGMKLAVDRARPDIEPLTTAAGASFPSGHAATAALCFAAFALLLGRGRSPRVRALLAGGAVGIAVFVAATRVLLGVHWFTDVVVGLAIGWAWFVLCGIAFGGRFLRFGAPAIAANRVIT